ncbi:MAG: hypothetical protein J6T32_03155 [Paludibacteraceae bacterium]|nr:hypothetical protein [Paludibacteraceae bacterium]
MKKNILFFLVCWAVLPLWATAVYTRIDGKPTEGWGGNKFLIVYELSATKARVWNGKDDVSNFTEVNLSDGKIQSDQLTTYQVLVSQESSNRYTLKTADGFIGGEAKKNSITISSNATECTLNVNGTYTILETNTNTCRFLFSQQANRFRFYYDKNKKWNDSDKKNIAFYVLGEVEQAEAQNQLDFHYAQANMYACDSKFPVNGDMNNQYFYTELFLAQEEDYSAVPQVNLEILAPTQYSIAGTYRSDYTPEIKYYINCTAGAKHSDFWFPNKSEQGYAQAAIRLAEMKITKVGKSSQPNAYIYHIRLQFTDSNQKIWTLDKDMDVFAAWVDCDRSGNTPVDMEPVFFALESGNHTPELDVTPVPEETSDSTRSVATKIIEDGVFYIQMSDGTRVNAVGTRINTFGTRVN